MNKSTFVKELNLLFSDKLKKFNKHIYKIKNNLFIKSDVKSYKIKVGKINTNLGNISKVYTIGKDLCIVPNDNKYEFSIFEFLSKCKEFTTLKENNEIIIKKNKQIDFEYINNLIKTKKSSFILEFRMLIKKIKSNLKKMKLDRKISQNELFLFLKLLKQKQNTFLKFIKLI
ncbi:MAG: hypothetical protein AAYR31_00360 [Candidatus Vidania fulgoroideorum]